MEPDFDAIIVGAGIVGLAVGRALALDGLRVAVLESESVPLTQTSSRNSEVIHAGIYYPPGSLKAALCVEGKHMLYDYCQHRGVPFQRLGKLIVATSGDDVAKLEQYKATAEENGVPDLEWRSQVNVAQLEPEIVCDTALFSPSTGILDTHAYALALQGDLEDAGGMVICHSNFLNAERSGDVWQIRVAEGDEVVTSRVLVNSAGLTAVDCAARIADLDPKFVPSAHYAIGHYFTLSGRAPFKHLIYPTATNAGLGVHVTLDIAGQARFGPDVAWVDRIDYSFDVERKASFVEAIKLYYPALDAKRLTPGYTGIRPKIAGPGEPAADFVISGPDEHGQQGLVNLFGIESPGITASLAIAARVNQSIRASH
ncbi:MAG: NAD(P)/FAD-dependent oxidoreductase [Pseudomonadota bacterium]